MPHAPHLVRESCRLLPIRRKTVSERLEQLEGLMGTYPADSEELQSVTLNCHDELTFVARPLPNDFVFGGHVIDALIWLAMECKHVAHGCEAAFLAQLSEALAQSAQNVLYETGPSWTPLTIPPCTSSCGEMVRANFRQDA